MLSLITTLPILLYVGYTDFKRREIENIASILLLLIGIVQAAFPQSFFGVSLFERFTVGFGIFVVLLILYKIRPEASGGGDLKLFSALGFCIGTLFFYVLFFSCLIGLIYAGITRKKGVPMGGAVALTSIILSISYILGFSL